MSDGISFLSNDDLDKHVKKVMTQTNYTEAEAKEKELKIKQIKAIANVKKGVVFFIIQ